MHVFEMVVLIMLIVGVWCFIRILRRAGHTAWWTLAMFLPGINILLVWAFAYARWPAVDYAHEFEGQNRYMPPGAKPRREREKASDNRETDENGAP